jgi:hypothetical protein
MSTRLKYNRVKPEETSNETKVDTDILMKISDRYGKNITYFRQIRRKSTHSLLWIR